MGLFYYLEAAANSTLFSSSKNTYLKTRSEHLQNLQICKEPAHANLLLQQMST